jgi:hypothetical protein
MMSTLNVHLLDFLMTEEFFENNVYPTSLESERKVAGFISEFYVLYKNLAVEVKNDITQTLKEKKIAPLAVSKIYELLRRARKLIERQRELDTRKLISELRSEEQADHSMEPVSESNLEDELTLPEFKNILVAHMEVLLVTIRKDKDYSYAVFREFGKVDEFMELLLEFPDDSTLTFQILTFRRPLRYVQ